MDASGKNKRVTMIKSVVGKVKSNQYALPDIVFGIANKMDLEGAGKGEVFFSLRSLSLLCSQSLPFTTSLFSYKLAEMIISEMASDLVIILFMPPQSFVTFTIVVIAPI